MLVSLGVDAAVSAKVADFGASVLASQTTIHNTRDVGTVAWMAPGNYLLLPSLLKHARNSGPKSTSRVHPNGGCVCIWNW